MLQDTIKLIKWNMVHVRAKGEVNQVTELCK